MTQLSQTSPKRPRRIVSESILSPEEIAQCSAAREEFAARCRPIFERLRPELIKDYYNWFIAIDPDSEHYLLDPNLEELIEKIRQKYPDGTPRTTIYRLNETGTCGRI